LLNIIQQLLALPGRSGSHQLVTRLRQSSKIIFRLFSIGNSETGIPLGILGLKPKTYSKIEWLKLCAAAPANINYLEGTKYLIAEMGIDEPEPPKNMEYLLTILKPDIAVLT